jgi:molybdopterin synthase catalytic subunit
MDHDPINIQLAQHEIDVVSASSLPSIGCGGECIFVGRTRPEHHEKHGNLLALQYACYPEMAEKELRSVAKEAIDRYSTRVVRVTHAIGRVAIDEASVVIATSSEHRKDAFDACQYIIDELKQRVPIWKQELWADGTTWKNGKPLQEL